MHARILFIVAYAGMFQSIFSMQVVGESLIPEIGCFRDDNGNGDLDSGEFSECFNTLQGNLCLLDNIPCTVAETAAYCPNTSSLNGDTDQCEYPVQYRCTSTASVYQTSAECSDGCDPSENCEIYCPDGMSAEGDTCISDPTCTTGSYNSGTDSCLWDVCPYGDYACLNMNGEKYCSELACLNSDESISNLGTMEGSGDLNDDGPRSEENICLGSIYIFSGQDRRCRSWGATIAFDDCCKSEDYLFGLMACSGSEQNLAALKGDGLCHYVGQYCSKEIDLLFTEVCVERSKTYCCFNSKLARIVQEQGRAQLSTFSGWGQASNPNCRGFTPEEFQVLDFSKIDLSEWHGDIETRAQEEIENDLKQGITDYYETIGNF